MLEAIYVVRHGVRSPLPILLFEEAKGHGKQRSRQSHPAGMIFRAAVPITSRGGSRVEGRSQRQVKIAIPQMLQQSIWSSSIRPFRIALLCLSRQAIGYLQSSSLQTNSYSSAPTGSSIPPLENTTALFAHRQALPPTQHSPAMASHKPSNWPNTSSPPTQP